MNKYKYIFLSAASVFTVLTVIMLTVIAVPKIRWDKVPIIGYFVLEIELWSSGFDASYLEEPIKWYQLDEEPADWEDNGEGSWFSMNPYTKNLLKEYMMENNLGIVPDEWPDFKFRSNLEECLDTFEFVELGEPIQTNSTSEFVCRVIAVISAFLAASFWIVLLRYNRNTSLLKRKIQGNCNENL